MVSTAASVGFHDEGRVSLGGVLSFALVLHVGVEPVVVVSGVGHLRMGVALSFVLRATLHLNFYFANGFFVYRIT